MTTRPTGRPHWIIALDYPSGLPLWMTALDYHTGLPHWIATLDCHTGVPHWITTLDYHTGLPHWITTLDYHTGLPLTTLSTSATAPGDYRISSLALFCITYATLAALDDEHDNAGMPRGIAHWFADWITTLDNHTGLPHWITPLNYPIGLPN